ncbi:50S ribosomal protein L20 [Candidatus Azambacteria bacterium RBG_16_47_10]|uniref:50S ribosomal protein L20 n=1 Tax=Candidatus Azambacteria bacterium RBG_16_47_10 TaxID=1797292 RepID=A0A1F5AY98_9BACT|nr:MAG: 50S ribosomal protein L20 [Candidatus Azambacteria bacterium RBG_16_47_10]
MPRVKRGVIANKKRKNLRKHTKGYRYGRNSKITRMREATAHAFSHMFAHRRKKKGDFRTLWNVQINAGSRANGIPYNALIAGLKKQSIALNRKMLALLAKEHPEIFAKVVASVK